MLGDATRAFGAVAGWPRGGELRLWLPPMPKLPQVHGQRHQAMQLFQQVTALIVRVRPLAGLVAARRSVVIVADAQHLWQPKTHGGHLLQAAA